MKITPTLQRTDRLGYKVTAERAGVPRDQIRRLDRRLRVCRVLVDDLWLETILEDWVVALRLVAQPEGVAIGELRVFPLAGRTGPGQWAGDLRGLRATTPPGGIGTRLLRQIRLDRSMWFGHEVLCQLSRKLGRDERGRAIVPRVLARSGIRSLARRRRGRPQLSRHEYAQAAREYRRLLLKRGRRGRLYEALAERLGLSVGQAINRVARARHEGLLSDIPVRPRRAPD